MIHAGFDDPPTLAAGARTDEDALPHYRRVRDEIRQFVENLPRTLKGVPTMADRTCCDDSCCAPAPLAPPAASELRDQVREGYARIAQGGCCSPGSAGGGCCGATAFSPEQLAHAVGYSSGELETLPDGANMGLSCGNPTAIASLRPGEVVLDLGSGGGFDCFIAGPKVGKTGRVIGVDMTPDMLTKARRNVAQYRQQTGLDNVEFRLGEIESLPVADSSVDVVISNCVLNLSPDKPRVWREIARVLRPGGRVAVSDLALLRPLPASIKADLEALVGCIAGAALVEETRAMASAAGLSDITLTPKPHYIDAMTTWEDPLYRRIIESLPAGSKPSDYITSLDVAAVRR
jgi:SAM-dependent methyltransferase